MEIIYASINTQIKTAPSVGKEHIDKFQFSKWLSQSSAEVRSILYQI